ncbi:MAG TPA: SpoIIIAH-like family protein [Clostridia bacterium]|nr:SpoIIIAH-like family protein [Clostridia bacterium]
MQIIIRKKTVLVLFIVITISALILAGLLEKGKDSEKGKDVDIQPGLAVNLATSFDSADDSDFFVEYRIERDRVRGQRIEYLREIINNPNSGAGNIDEAQTILLNITRTMEQEIELENLIRARGFSDVVVSFLEGIITVVLDTGDVSEVDKHGLMELVSRGTGLELAKIDIIMHKHGN